MMSVTSKKRYGTMKFISAFERGHPDVLDPSRSSGTRKANNEG